MREKIPCAYILASRRNGTLYTGVTGNLLRRIFEHKNGMANGFTKKYGVRQLVYYEVCPSMEAAIMREKQIKAGSRRKKVALIEKTNPDWRDLIVEIVG
jgi:putative endonuclease